MTTAVRELAEAARAHHAAPSDATRARLDALGLTPLPVGSGHNNTLFVGRLDGQPRCVKLYRIDERRRGLREWTALNLLYERGLPVAPAPLHLEDGAEPTVVVMELVPGRPLTELAVDRAHLRVEAAALRALYAVRPPDDYPFESLGSPRLIVPRVRAFAELAEAEDAAFARAVGPFLGRWREAGDGELAEAAAPGFFIQGDRNPANSLWRDGVIRIVDWEYAGRSDFVFELADQVESIRRRVVPDADWAWFLSLFELDAAERDRFEAGRRTAALFWALALWDRLRRGRPADHGPDRQLERLRTVFAGPLG